MTTPVFLPEAAYQAALTHPFKAFLEGAALGGCRSSPLVLNGASAQVAWSSPLNPKLPLWVLSASDVSQPPIDVAAIALTGSALLLYLMRDGHWQQQVQAAQVNVAYVLLPAQVTQAVKSNELQNAAVLNAPNVQLWQNALLPLLNWPGRTSWQPLPMADVTRGAPNDLDESIDGAWDQRIEDATPHHLSQTQPSNNPDSLVDSAARASYLMQQYQRLLLALRVAAA